MKNKSKILLILLVSIRLTANSFLDCEFGTQGIIRKKIGNLSVAGKILSINHNFFLLGNSDVGFFFIRNEKNNLGNPTFFLEDIKLAIQKKLELHSYIKDNNNNLIILCSCLIDGLVNILLIKYDSNCSIDTNFGNQGYLLFPFNCGIIMVDFFEVDHMLFILGNCLQEDKIIPFLLRIDRNQNIQISYVESLYQKIIIASVARNDNEIVIAGKVIKNAGDSLFLGKLRSPAKNELDIDINFLNKVENDIRTIKIVDSKTGEKFLLVETSYNNLLMKFDNHLEQDTSFGNEEGILQLSEGIKIESLKVLGEKILLIGNYKSQVYLAQYNFDGTVDTSFGNNGIINPALGSMSIAADVFIEQDGKMLVAGMIDSQMALLRFRNPTIDALYISQSNYDQTNPKLYLVNGSSSKLTGEIELYIDENYFQTIGIHSDGSWDAEINTESLINGKHMLRAILKNSDIYAEQEFVVANQESIIIKNVIDLQQYQFIFGVSNMAHLSVMLSCNGIQLAEAKTNNDGRWSACIEQALMKNHIITAQLTDIEGSVKASAIISL